MTNYQVGFPPSLITERRIEYETKKTRKKYGVWGYLKASVLKVGVVDFTQKQTKIDV